MVIAIGYFSVITSVRYNHLVMKDKNIAALLALFFGWIGVHRFYLRQYGLGILYLILLGTGISFLLGLIDAIAFFVMDSAQFDQKYNRRYVEDPIRSEVPDFERRAYRHRPSYQRMRARPHRSASKFDELTQVSRLTKAQRKKVKQLIKEGKEHFEAYEIEEAIKAFEEAKAIDPKNPALHFNLACAWSLLENSDKAFAHLDAAVALGFDDFDRIRNHEALAFLRVQPLFESFEANGFRLPPPEQKEALASPSTQPADELLQNEPNLLDQLNKLRELRSRGLLTQEEYEDKKRELLGE